MSSATVNKVIRFWDRVGLSSLESSTFKEDIHFSNLYNYIESNLIESMIKENVAFEHALDIGAGYGRFTKILSGYFNEVTSLEPAEKIAEKLVIETKDIPNIKVLKIPFEKFCENGKYDIMIVSGVLYFYDDQQVNSFFQKATGMLKPHGKLIIRDFIHSRHDLKSRSSCVEGEFCYYRTVDYWNRLSEAHQFSINRICESRYHFNKYINKIIRVCKGERLIDIDLIKRILLNRSMKKFNEGRIGNQNRVYTVFIELTRKVN